MSSQQYVAAVCNYSFRLIEERRVCCAVNSYMDCRLCAAYFSSREGLSWTPMRLLQRDMPSICAVRARSAGD